MRMPIIRASQLTSTIEVQIMIERQPGNTHTHTLISFHPHFHVHNDTMHALTINQDLSTSYNEMQFGMG